MICLTLTIRTHFVSLKFHMVIEIIDLKCPKVGMDALTQ